MVCVNTNYLVYCATKMKWWNRLRIVSLIFRELNFWKSFRWISEVPAKLPMSGFGVPSIRPSGLRAQFKPYKCIIFWCAQALCKLIYYTAHEIILLRKPKIYFLLFCCFPYRYRIIELEIGYENFNSAYHPYSHRSHWHCRCCCCCCDCCWWRW